MTDRLSLFNYDVVRELCPSCGKEKFHFVPPGADADPGECHCGSDGKIADLSDTSIRRLIVHNGEIVVRRF
jgi:hypothetical protein